MPIKHFQNNFSSGEWSPRLDSRADLAKYQNACRYLENMLILPHGGVTGRGGLHYVGATKYSNRKSRLIPFEFNVEQAYQLEFGHSYIRFLMNHAQITSPTVDYSLLLHMNGEEGSKTFSDDGYVVHTVTANGTAKITTAQKVFGSGSGYFDGLSAYLSTPDHADFDLSAGTWTIDFRVYSASKSGTKTLYYQGTDANNYFHIYLHGGTSPLYHPHLHFEIISGGNPIVSLTSTQLFVGSWYHIQLCADGSKYFLFVDGFLDASSTDADVPANYTGSVCIGADSTPANYFKGWLDEFRVLKGTCANTAGFAPPSQQYSGGTTPYEIASPYTEDQLPKIQKAQAADTMFLVNPNYSPRKLTRTGHHAWTLSVIDFIDGPWRDEETTITFTPSATTGNITLVASSAFFQDAHVDSLLRLKFGSITYGYHWTGDPDDSGDWNQTACVLAAINAPGQGEAGDDYYMRIFQTGGPTQKINRDITGIAIGTVYKLRVAIKNGTGTWASGVLRVTNNAGTVILGERPLSSSAAWTEFVLYFKATETNNKMEMETTLGSGTTAFFDTLGVSDATAAGTTSWGYVEITAVTDSTNAAATVKSALGAGDSIAYREAAWSDVYGWPGAVMFHEDRLWFGRDLTFWGSKKGDQQQENFTPGVNEYDPVSFTLKTDRVNLLRWISSSRKLMLGTAGDEFWVGGDPYISPTNVAAKADTFNGSEDISPVRVGSATLFVQRFGRKLRELIYSQEVDSYVSPDLTILAEHITEPKIIDMAYQPTPDQTVWALRSDGVFLGMTYLRSEDVVGWGRHETDGQMESISVIPAPDGSRHEIWAVVAREINGSTVRYIEYLDPDIFVDSGLTYSGTPTDTVTGLGHLEGETVKIVGDGAVFADDVVESGTVVLSSACSEIYVGLGYTPLLQTMRPEVQLGNGNSRAMPKSWGDLWVALLDTVGCTINDEELAFRAGGAPLDEAVEPFTGAKKVNQTGWGEGIVEVKQTQPLPITVLAIFGDFDLGAA